MMESTERIRRITDMEAVLDTASAAVAAMNAALDAYEALQPQMQRLEAYYTGPQWLADHDADGAGALPAGLKRGVLSEDAVYDLLTDRQTLLQRMAALAGKEKPHGAE